VEDGKIFCEVQEVPSKNYHELQISMVEENNEETFGFKDKNNDDSFSLN